MNIKAGNFVVVKDWVWAIRSHDKKVFIRDFLQPHEIGTALIEVERLRRFEVQHTPPRDLDTIVNVVTNSVSTILESFRDDENKLEYLIDAGVLIANAIEHIVKNAK